MAKKRQLVEENNNIDEVEDEEASSEEEEDEEEDESDSSMDEESDDEADADDESDSKSVDSSHEFNLNEESDDETNEADVEEVDVENNKNNIDSVSDDEAGENQEANNQPSGLTGNQVTHSANPISSSGNVAKYDEYQYDSSDEEDLRNTIGNIPVEWYNQYEHIGYNRLGQKIVKPKDTNDGNEVDHFLSKLEDPNYWRTVKDKFTGENVILTDEDAEIASRIKKGLIPDANYDPYPDFVDFFTYEKMIHPVTNRPERKATFIPSISEKRAVSKLVMKLKRQWQKPKVHVKPKDEKYNFNYDVWEKEIEESRKDAHRRRRHIPAPKMKLPGHQESYNPPPEYLPENDTSLKQVPSGFVPHKFPNLRSVPFYNNFVKERFERCLDLYLCPRATKMKSQVNPEDLIPKLPRPKDLQPFPTVESMVYKGHGDSVNGVSFEPRGEFFASASSDNCVYIWETLTGRCFSKFTFDSPVNAVAWNPVSSIPLLAVASGKDVILINPDVCDKVASSQCDSFINELESLECTDTPISTWKFYDSSDENWQKGHRAVITHKFEVNQLDWHHKGHYLSVVLPNGANRCIVIHQLAKKRSQLPFSKYHGQIVCALFHPSKPFFFVATKQLVKIYDLDKQELSKKLSPNCKIISSMAIHPKGDNLIIGSFDCRLPWFDLDAGSKPYKIMRYHKKSIRSVAFSPKYPLFASGSDDGSLIVSHGMVYDDLLMNPLIVPVKILHGHVVTDSVGVTDCKFHPSQPWVISSGADKTIRLFS